MRQVVATALVALLLLFLMPLLFLRGGGGEAQTQNETEPTATLPLDRTVVSPPPQGKTDAQTEVKVKMADGTVTTLTMEQYLWRVVAAEMPASFEIEALKAQAVAARTYTVSRMAQTESNHPDADVCTDINCCQAYLAPESAAANWGGSAQAYTDKVTAAVAETDGMIATYQGAPIQAVFFSSTAGRTVDAVEVWGNSVPYLASVESPEGDEVPNYHSTVSVPLETFRTTLLAQAPQADLSGEPGGWFQNIIHNSAGGVEKADVGGVTVSGGTLRSLFGLRSSNFTVSADSANVLFSVTGYGHGVGMSQYGANAMAKAGKSYTDIIKWYYTGVTVEKMK